MQMVWGSGWNKGAKTPKTRQRIDRFRNVKEKGVEKTPRRQQTGKYRGLVFEGKDWE